MCTEEAKDRKDKAGSAGSGCAPMGPGMFEMMKKCCEQGGFTDCSTMMKGMKETRPSQSCCAPKTKDAGPEEGKHEGVEQ